MSTANLIHESPSTTEFNCHAQAVIDQLSQESNYLDYVIAECGKLTKHLFRQNSTKSTNGPSSDESSTARAAALQQIDNMQTELNQKFGSMQSGRQKMQAALHACQQITGTPLTVSRLAALVAEPIRKQLQRQRIELKKKLYEFQAVMLSNQVVLAYDLEFNQRLMDGLTGSVPSAGGYNANGQMNHRKSSTVLRKDC